MKFKTLIRAIALSVAALAGMAAQGQAENLAGIHIGDTLTMAVTSLGQPTKSWSADLPGFRNDAWLFGDNNSLQVTTRVFDNKIVCIMSIWGGKSGGKSIALTDFPGLLFGRTTRTQLIDRLGSRGLDFSGPQPPNLPGELASFLNSYEIGAHHPLIVSFMTVARPEVLKFPNVDDYATLGSIALIDSNYANLIWGDMLPPPANYHRLSLGTFQGTETSDTTEIALESADGGWRLPVTVNQTLTVPFVLDTGAQSIQIPSDVYSVLQRQGKISPEDFRGTTPVVMADGSEHKENCFLIHELKVSDRTISNIRGCVSPAGSDPLLGQAFLERLGGYRVDNQRHVLTLE